MVNKPLSNEATAEEADEIQAELAPLLRKRSHLGSAVALALMAAHHVIHDGADEEDFILVCSMAWRKAAELHPGRS